MVDEDKVNMQIRKFLKEVGVTSQRAIEKAVMHKEEDGGTLDGQSIKAVMTLRIADLDIEHTVESELKF
ncbi:MAG: hypothetical protein HKN42_16320 [Granulosicoccus sp.]|nr:hypothetical protein [Granulosicoccus sp.]